MYITQPTELGSKKQKQPIRDAGKFEVFARHLINGLLLVKQSTDIQKVRKRADQEGNQKSPHYIIRWSNRD